MKKIITILSVCLLAVSCAKFTDLKPKGMNMLSSADELELLLNTEFRDFYNFDMYQIPGDLLIGTVGNIANLISLPTPSRNSILVTWDAANVRRLAELTASDDDYRMLYGFIGKIANPILASVEFATGEPAKIAQIKAEALCMRAWAEFLLVTSMPPPTIPPRPKPRRVSRISWRTGTSRSLRRNGPSSRCTTRSWPTATPPSRRTRFRPRM